MTEVKMKFNPGRHPQVMSRQKTAEECRSEFFDMFNTLHNVSTGFREDRSVSLQQFMEYHHFVGAHMDNDNYFKLFITGVWDLDIKDQSQEVSRAAGSSNKVVGLNSREQWKYDMHRSLFE